MSAAARRTTWGGPVPTAAGLVAVTLAALLFLTGQPPRPAMMRLGERPVAGAHDGHRPTHPLLAAPRRPEAPAPTSYRAPLADASTLGGATVLAAAVRSGGPGQPAPYTLDLSTLPEERAPPGRPTGI